jgi:hypothetical protein
MSMAQPSNEEVVRRYVDALNTHDGDALRVLRCPDWTEDWPQSGERVRGHDNDQKISDNWPGGRPTPLADHVVGTADRWVVTPAFTLQRIVGSGDFWWGDGKVAYPDGSTWFFVALLELRDGKMLHETWYFALPFEAPEWRATWVERVR